MKRLIILIAISAAINMNAQNKNYYASMKSHIAIADTARTIELLQPLEKTFKKIAEEEKKEWLPYYYAAYCNVMIAYTVKGKTIDSYCDKADFLVSKADSLNPNNSEIISLKSQIVAARISVSPITRASQYGTTSRILREKAMKLDPTNPRPWFLEGMSLFHTPVMFGGGKDKAKVAYNKAIELFEKFKPATSIAPDWGKKATEYYLNKCN